MKKIFKYSLALLTMALGFTACSDSDDDSYKRGDWNAAGDYANIYFESSSSSVELDPADPTEYTFKVYRRNTANALSLQFEVTENTDNVFSVGSADFAAGDSVATVKATFPNAQVGKTYTLQVTTTDPSYVSYYSSGIQYTLDVTRVKWKDVGYYIDADGNKVEGMAMYTDDFITGFFGVDNVSWPVRLQERDDKKGYFRIINAYNEDYIYNEPGDWDTSKEYYIYIDATDPEKVFIPHYCETGINWGYGMISVSSMAGYYLAREKPEDAEDNYGTYKNGKITFPSGSLLISMADYQGGAFYSANGAAAFKLVVDPSKDLYEASVKKDFEWEKVFTGAFDSGQLGTSSEVTLYKGNITTKQDSCDVRFAEAYGVPYRMESPYAEGTDIYFCVRDGKVVVPEEIALQKTGINAVGTDVYMKINGNTSTFSPTVISLAATFQNEDASMVYGSAEEVLSNITYTQVATGTWNFSAMEESGSIPVGGIILSKRDDKEDVYRIDNFGAGYLTKDGVPVIFTWDTATNECILGDNYTGYDDANYGPLYVSDLSTYSSSNFPRETYANTYDEATKTFTFYIIYFVSEGYFGYGIETFTITPTAGSKLMAPSQNAGWKSLEFGHPKRNIKKQSQFVGKKSSPKMLKGQMSTTAWPM